MNKPIYIVLPILEIRKKVVFKFWYDYRKKNTEKEQNFIAWVQRPFQLTLKTKRIYVDNAKDI